MIRLIANADDFGLTPGVNRSILELHHSGALTSATLMATANHFTEAAARAADYPSLGVGCHVLLVDGRPVLTRSDLPSLVTPTGELRPTLGRFVLDLMRGEIDENEIESEAVAQIRRLQSACVHVTHLDTHKHTHVLPRVLRPLLRAARRCGVSAIRNPFEPDWALRATPGAPVLRRMQIRLLRTQRSEFLRLVKQAGVATTDGAIGVLATGTLNVDTLQALLAALPPGTWELVCHPGYFDDNLGKIRTRLRESRNVEHAALLDAIPKFFTKRPEIERVNFGDLTP